MTRTRPEKPALDVPGQADGRATLQSDRGDETQSLFMYQWSAGVVLLSGALASVNEYIAVWCEHHDDLLGELDSGRFHAIQVKTTSAQGKVWTCNDSGFVDAVRKFCEHESKYASQVEKYIFFSNAKPYIPAATAKVPAKLASSPMRVCGECITAPDCSAIPSPYKSSFDVLVTGTGADPTIVFQVLRKLQFRERLAVPRDVTAPGC